MTEKVFKQWSLLSFYKCHCSTWHPPNKNICRSHQKVSVFGGCCCLQGFLGDTCSFPHIYLFENLSLLLLFKKV